MQGEKMREERGDKEEEGRERIENEERREQREKRDHISMWHTHAVILGLQKIRDDINKYERKMHEAYTREG